MKHTATFDLCAIGSASAGEGVLTTCGNSANAVAGSSGTNATLIRWSSGFGRLRTANPNSSSKIEKRLKPGLQQPPICTGRASGTSDLIATLWKRSIKHAVQEECIGLHVAVDPPPRTVFRFDSEVIAADAGAAPPATF